MNEADEPQASNAYREAMHRLGLELGSQLRGALPAEGEILFVTAVEDADYLARGVLDAVDAGARLPDGL